MTPFSKQILCRTCLRAEHTQRSKLQAHGRRRLSSWVRLKTGGPLFAAFVRTFNARLGRNPEGPRETAAGGWKSLRTFAACSWTRAMAWIGVVRVLDGSEGTSLMEIKTAAVEMPEWIEYKDEAIPLKGVRA